MGFFRRFRRSREPEPPTPDPAEPADAEPADPAEPELEEFAPALTESSRAEAAARQAMAIGAFWHWWADEGREQVTEAISDGDADRVGRPLAARASGIEEGLEAQLAPGVDAEYALIVRPSAAPELRPVARRWLREAPEPDSTWEYSDLHVPVPNLDDVAVSVGDDEMRLADAMVAARREGHRLDVSFYLPAFERLEEEVRQYVALLGVEATLGEADTAFWLGELEPSTVPPLDGFRLMGLRSVVRDLKAELVDEDGNPTWALLRGEGSEGPVIAVAQIPLSPLVAPDLDVHVAVLVPYADQDEDGFPGPASTEALRLLEEHLAERLGVSGRIVAHQSHRGLRVFHVYVDGTTPAVDQIRVAVSGWEQGEVVVDATEDPTWSAVSHLQS
jgi:hypothetical protein